MVVVWEKAPAGSPAENTRTRGGGDRGEGRRGGLRCWSRDIALWGPRSVCVLSAIAALSGGLCATETGVGVDKLVVELGP